VGKILIDNIDQNYDAWIAQKRTRAIGSGDIATICGANPYQTALKLWAVKTGREDPDPENDHMFWGKMQEKPIAELTSRRLNLIMEYGNKLFAHDNLEWARATPDFFATSNDWNMSAASAFEFADIPAPGEQVIVECKNVSYRAGRYWLQDTPLAPRLQVLWQMGIVGNIKSAVIAPLIGGDIIEGFAPRFVQYDQAIFDQLLEQADKFMWHLNNDVPPAPADGDQKLLEKLQPTTEKEVVIEDPEIERKIHTYLVTEAERKELDDKVKELKAQENTLKLQVRAAMNGATYATCGGHRIKAKLIEIEPFQNKGSKYTKITID
jgi:putative phage-type endonuclease